MVIQMLLCFHCIDAQLTSDGWICKYFRSVPLIQNIICNVLNNGSRLFIVDKCSRLDDKLFWIIFKLIKDRFLNTTQNCNYIFTGQFCFFHQLANQIIFYTAIGRNSRLRTVRSRSLFHKGSSSFQSFFRFNLFHDA